jgi:ornithine decarboxylase
MQLKISMPHSEHGLGVDNERPLSQLNHFLSSTNPHQLLNELSRDTEEAFFLCDLGSVVRQLRMWRQMLPRVIPFYAVKCNDDVQLLKLLSTLGLGFDCASKGEISQLLASGVAADRIIYANPCKQNSHVKYAASHDVNFMTFDSEGELVKLRKTHPSAMLVLRIATDDSQSVCPLGMKFGAHLAKCKEILQLALEIGSSIVGISFHVGSGCLDASAYGTALKNAAHVFKMGVSMGFDFTVLDIGGGFPGFAPCEDNPSASFKDIAEVVNQGLEKHFSLWPSLTVIAEPGRFIAAAAFTLSTNVISVKPDVGKDGEDTSMCYVNDGVYGSFNCLLYDHAKVTPIPLDSLTGGPNLLAGEGKFSVWGPSCDGLDKIHAGCMLPADLAPGDWLVFDNMGAYTLAAASTFNGFPKPQVHYFISSSDLIAAQQLVRKPFSVDQLAGVAADNSCVEYDRQLEQDESQYLESLLSSMPLPVMSI